MAEPMTPYCPYFHRAVKTIARRWTPEILRAMLAGSTRFGEIAATIPGLSDRLLAERLKTLEAEELLTRTVTPHTPVRIEYRLTDKGKDLGTTLTAVDAWANTWVTDEQAGVASR
jgi:DNA-binding HxlR family transcriptional regulator